ncbi:MAG: phenylalanine--tRNA ligase subunit beta, partial [Nocardioidaceae bacterium]|nr:phenylalanine--tRNA ligase subunit beta [Nocardioidaceae bacterium]
RLAVGLSGERQSAGWWGDGRPASWADAVAAVHLVADTLGVAITVEQGAAPPWHPGRCARVILAGATIGHAGELHPQVCVAWGIPPRTSYAEVDLDVLVAAAPPLPQAPGLSSMPVAKEDIALVIPAEVPAAAVLEALRRGAGELLESVRLFDVYTGDPVPSGHRSLAFSLRLRAADRTLTESDAAAVRDAAVAEAARATGARLRS